jgi:multiple sugar transport system substrate-binding protein
MQRQVQRQSLNRRMILMRGARLGAAPAMGVVLAACGGSDATTSGAPAVQPSTVRYLHVDTGEQVWQQNWSQIFSNFETKYPGFKLQVDMVPTIPKSVEKALATMAGGDYYDFLYGHLTAIAPYLQADAIQPLDPFLSKDRDVAAADFNPAATYRWKGKLYGIAVRTFGKEIWYNADLFSAAGLQTPRQMEKDGKWTWDALLETSRKLTRAEGDAVSVYGFNYGFADPTSFIHSLWAWGADWWDKGFSKPTLDTQPFLASTQFAVDMVSKSKVAGGGNFVQGKLAMTVTSSNYTRTVDETAMMPKGPAGRTIAMANNDSYIAKSAKSPEAAWLFYKYLLGKEAQPQFLSMGSGRYVASKKIKPTALRDYEDSAVYEASAAISRATPLIMKQADFDKAWSESWADMIGGKQGVREALTQMQARAIQFLKEGGCVC